MKLLLLIVAIWLGLVALFVAFWAALFRRINRELRHDDAPFEPERGESRQDACATDIRWALSNYRRHLAEAHLECAE